MYKKLARIGPISFGIFFALLSLLMIILVAVLGIFILPNIPVGDGPEITALDPLLAPFLELTQTQEGLIQLAISIGFLLLGYFIVGLVMAILYNIVATITGGIKVRVEDIYDDI